MPLLVETLDADVPSRSPRVVRLWSDGIRGGTINADRTVCVHAVSKEPE